MKPTAERHPSTFEQEILWSVLDQDSLQHVLLNAQDHWKVGFLEPTEKTFSRLKEIGDGQ
jgi:hypothetical protein